MEQAWRWFGPKDPIALAHVREAGATGIVTALHQIPGGTAWTEEAVAERKAMIEAAGLRWSVVESIPVTNAIKAQTAEWRKDVDAWKASLRALGKAGIRTVCYNFMPIVDWTRTDLAYPLKSGLALRFDLVDFVAYDVFVLRRQRAEVTTRPKPWPRRSSGSRRCRRRGRRNWSGSSSPACPARTSPMTGQNSSTS